MKSTYKKYLVVQNDMTEIYGCIEHVYDNRIQDIEVLGITVYDMRHNKLM